jgi:CHAT domain-containing protein
MIEGEVFVETDPEKAVGLFTSALQVYEENRQILQAMMAHRARGHAHRKAGSLDLAATDIEASLEAYEKLGENAGGGIRLAFLAKTKEIFDEAISFEALDRHRPETAFAYSDLARTRVLPGAISNLHKGLDQGKLFLAEGASLSPQEIRTSLPEETALVQYRALGDRVLMWLVQRDGIELFETPIPLDHLQGLIERARSSPEETRELSQVLLSPWMPRIQPGERIVFAPDEVLDGVPFSCLKEIRTGRYLLEDHEVLITPSATLYVRTLAREKRGGSAPRSEPGLVLGNPSFDRTRFGLSDLPSAEAEAQRVAGMYPGSQLLLKNAATRKAFLEGAQHFSWIHFAGHAVINRDQPLFSMLVLAPASDGSDSGVLYGHEIYGLKLASTRLVVLSACDTGNESGSDEGSTSIARAFLAAGVPTVVASLWATDDRASAELFARFHERLRAGDDPAKALRFAQLSLLKSGIPSLQQPSKWGAFELIGASVH